MLVTTAIGDLSVPWVSAVQAAGKQYHTTTKGNPGHGLGGPAPLLWAGFVEGII